MIKLYKLHQTGKVGWWSGEVVIRHGQTYINTEAAGSETAKPTPHSVLVRGKNLGKASETKPYDQACLELASKAKKKMDKGYVEEKPDPSQGATNTLGLTLPQKAMAYKDMSDRQLNAIDWDNAFVQRKYDGHRALVKDGVMYSSGGKIIDLPHLKGLPNNIHLDGELYIHGMKLQDIGSLVKKYRPDETEQLLYVVFDHVDSTGFEYRYDRLLQIGQHPSVVVAPTWKVTSMDQVLAFHKQFVSEGYEGAMLRQGTNGYKGGARSSDIIKLKSMDDAEYEITDVVEAKQRMYKGYMVRQARFECYCHRSGKFFKVLAPGTVPEKRLPLDNPEKWVGKQLTVQYFGFTSDGLPNLPIAKCLREDL